VPPRTVFSQQFQIFPSNFKGREGAKMNGSERLRCVRYEMTQRKFRRLRGEKWSPSFISKFGKLASKLYRELYKKEPPFRWANPDDLEPVNVYPYGILEQAYRRLIAAGEQIGEPYREPDPASKLKEPYREADPASKLKEPYRDADPASKAVVRYNFSHGRSKEEVVKKILAKFAAGWRPHEGDDGVEDDAEQDDEFY
jgi:hypothetical protein